MPNKLSEDCKKRLREIDGQLLRICSGSVASERDISKLCLPLFRNLHAVLNDDDTDCRKVLRDIEPLLIRVISRPRDADAYVIPDAVLQNDLKHMYSVVQILIREQLD